MTMYVTDKETLTKMVKVVTQDGVTVGGYHLRKKYCSSRKLKIGYLLIPSLKPT